MQTQSHMLINLALGKQLEKRGIRPMYWALAIGSLIPDIPLTLLTVNHWFQQRVTLGNVSPEQLFGEAYDALYFTDPLWITGHSLFHAPLLIALWLAIGWFFGYQQGQTWGKWFFWFAVGNAGHSFVDILTHANDGPLLLYPLNWRLRFSSPVSYWDPNHYGNIFAPLELALNIVLIGYFVFTGIIQPHRRKHNEPTSAIDIE